MMDKSKMLNPYPEILNVEHIQSYLGIGRDQTYMLVKSGQFHVARSGRRYLVDKDVFKRWLTGEGS